MKNFISKHSEYLKNVARVGFLFLILTSLWTPQVHAEDYSDVYGRVVRKCTKLLGIDEDRYRLDTSQNSGMTSTCVPIGTTGYPSGLTSFTLDLLNERDTTKNAILKGAAPHLADQMAGREIDETATSLVRAAHEWLQQEEGISDEQERNQLIINSLRKVP